MRTYKWYVQPHDSGTNTVIVDLPGIDRENGFGEVLCGDGNRRSMWSTPGRSTISALKKSRDDLGLDFTIWVQAGNGKVRVSPLDSLQVRRKSRRGMKNQMSFTYR